MVRSLKKKDYAIKQVSKNKGVVYWIASMKKKKVHLVIRNEKLGKFVKIEQQNYRFKEVNGIAINQPIDKYNHMWDSSRYAHMSFNTPLTLHQTTESLNELGINY